MRMQYGVSHDIRIHVQVQIRDGFHVQLDRDVAHFVVVHLFDVLCDLAQAGFFYLSLHNTGRGDRVWLDLVNRVENRILEPW